MGEKENNGNVLNLMENLKNGQNNAQIYLQHVIKHRQFLEEKIKKDNLKLTQLEETMKELQNENAVSEFKVGKLDKDTEELEGKNKCLREEIENVQTKIKTLREKHISDLELLQTDVVNLCELFSSAAFTYNRESVKEEIKKIYKATEEAQKQYNAVQEELNLAKNELDDIVLYRIPQNQEERDIPLGQRKMVLNLFEEALFKADARLDQLKSKLAAKEKDLENLAL